MNRRQTKKALKQALQVQIAPKQDIASLVGEIQSLAYRITAETEFCVFADYSGHTNQLDIKIARSKEAYHDEVSTCEYFYLDEDRRPISKLIRLRDNLQRILDNGELPYSTMREETLEQSEYRLA